MTRVEIRDGYAHYECGCKFEVVEIGPPVRLKVVPDVNHLPLNCQRTWELIGEGNTKGVFQLETNFGQQYAKKLKPDNMEQLAALSAILRPGCKNAIRDGVSVTDHYIKRKHGEEPVEYFHPDLQKIVGSTFGEMIYQEQAMQIAQHFAGFDLQQADVLRKAIGKKKADIMAAVKKDFMEGCEKQGIINNEQAEELFGWIEKSQRYSFNKSHAVSYAMNSYVDAFLKAHFPVSFFTARLYYAKDKKPKPFDEVKLLVTNAKMMNINIYPPSFKNDFPHFRRISEQMQVGQAPYNPWDDKIYFGFGDIREVGDSAVAKIKRSSFVAETVLGKPRKDWNWLEFLMFFSQQEVSSTTVVAMIEAGALDYFGMDRTRMIFEYKRYSELTELEQAWLKQNLYGKKETLLDMLREAISLYEIETSKKKPEKAKKPFSNKNRYQKIKGIVQVLEKPPRSLDDTIDWIARVEESRLGTSITANIVDGCKGSEQANCTLLDFVKRRETGSGIFIACQIESIKPHIQNNGEEMAFVTVTDGEISLDSVIFADSWAVIKNSGLCYEENTVMVSGDRSNRGGGLIIKKMWQLS
jgi:DNA polymerase-3 subunit alpha